MGTYALTGSASGIGASLASELRAEGHTVITVDIKDADIVADLSTLAGRESAVSGILAASADGLDGFIPVAGLGGGGVASGELITAVNYFGTVDLVNGLRPALEKARGNVVLLASNSAPMDVQHEGYINALLAGDEQLALDLAANEVPDGTHYMLGKRAIVFWMQREVMGFGRSGIRINAVAPGPVLTAMTKPLFESEEYAPVMQGLLDATPIQRAADPGEISACIRFLLSDAASYVSGSVLFIDGGYDAHVRQGHI
jgi:NAD(P)-dependent dehydrogenase (short-subunit alcohol dehydrogenase family)